MPGGRSRRRFRLGQVDFALERLVVIVQDVDVLGLCAPLQAKRGQQGARRQQPAQIVSAKVHAGQSDFKNGPVLNVHRLRECGALNPFSGPCCGLRVGPLASRAWHRKSCQSGNLDASAGRIERSARPIGRTEDRLCSGCKSTGKLSAQASPDRRIETIRSPRYWRRTPTFTGRFNL
jgi:hypothetical protein